MDSIPSTENLKIYHLCSFAMLTHINIFTYCFEKNFFFTELCDVVAPELFVKLFVCQATENNSPYCNDSMLLQGTTMIMQKFITNPEIRA